MSDECSKCGAHLVLVPAILEGYPDYWTCTKCDADNCKRCGGEMILCPEPHYWVCSNCYHMNHPDCEVSEKEWAAKRIRLMLTEFSGYLLQKLEVDKIASKGLNKKVSFDYLQESIEEFIDKHFPLMLGDKDVR